MLKKEKKKEKRKRRKRKKKHLGRNQTYSTQTKQGMLVSAPVPKLANAKTHCMQLPARAERDHFVMKLNPGSTAHHNITPSGPKQIKTSMRDPERTSSLIDD